MIIIKFSLQPFIIHVHFCFRISKLPFREALKKVKHFLHSEGGGVTTSLRYTFQKHGSNFPQKMVKYWEKILNKNLLHFLEIEYYTFSFLMKASLNLNRRLWWEYPTSFFRQILQSSTNLIIIQGCHDWIRPRSGL